MLERLALQLEHLWQLLEQPLRSLRDTRWKHPIVAATVVVGGWCWLDDDEDNYQTPTRHSTRQEYPGNAAPPGNMELCQERPGS